MTEVEPMFKDNVGDCGCVVPGCSRPLNGKTGGGLCPMHYMRRRTHGDVGPVGSTSMRGLPADERFWAKVRQANGCWEWTATRLASGYGRFYPKGNRGVLAHRYAYELLVGPIPSGLQLDHLCRNRGCVNPEHLEPVTNSENQRRGVGAAGVNARKTHCVRGHALTESNLYKRPSDPPGSRGECRTCLSDRQRRSIGGRQEKRR